MPTVAAVAQSSLVVFDLRSSEVEAEAQPELSSHLDRYVVLEDTHAECRTLRSCLRRSAPESLERCGHPRAQQELPRVCHEP